MQNNLAEASAWNETTLSCPFFNSTGQDCKATCVNQATTASQQLCYCETEDYEDCPLFLSRLLRNSQPKFRGLLDLALK